MDGEDLRVKKMFFAAENLFGVRQPIAAFQGG